MLADAAMHINVALLEGHVCSTTYQLALLRS